MTKIVAIAYGVIDVVKMTIGQFVQNEYGDVGAMWWGIRYMKR